MPRTAWRRSAAVLALVLVPVLSACSIGVNAGTTSQGPSGNGASKNAGDIALRGITLVTALSDSSKATLIGTVVNQSLTEDDVLTGIAITAPTGATATISGPDSATAIPLPSGRPTSAVRIGFNADYTVDITGLKVDPSAFATVTFTFQKAGDVPVQVMTVPPVGIYAGLGPALG